MRRKHTVFDIETDGLLNSITKIHCLSYSTKENGVVIERGTLIELEDIKNFIESSECLIGHNIIRYDIPVLRKFNINCNALLIDTLALSWYIEPSRNKHGLESYGEEFENEKIEIKDWENPNKFTSTTSNRDRQLPQEKDDVNDIPDRQPDLPF